MAFYWVILSHSPDLHERATRGDFEVTKNSKLKKLINRSSIFTDDFRSD